MVFCKRSSAKFTATGEVNFHALASETSTVRLARDFPRAKSSSSRKGSQQRDRGEDVLGSWGPECGS